LSRAVRRFAGLGRGFTLMELVVALALLALMAAMAAPLSEVAVQSQKEEQLRQALRDIRSAIDQYKQAVDQGLIQRRIGDAGYPPDLETLVKGVPNQQSPSRVPIVFLRRIPRDPFNPDTTVPAAATWKLRCYESPADAPSPGANVYDVVSMAKGKGLNGIDYSLW